MHKSKVLLMAGGFVLLSAVGIGFAARQTNFQWNETFALVHFGWHHVFWILLINAMIYLSDATRYYFMSRALGAPTSLYACLQSVVVNLLFGWISPGSALGAPAGAFMLYRNGTPAEATIPIAFGRSSLLMVTSILIAAGVLLAGYPLPLADSFLSRAIVAGLSLLTLILVFLPILAILPYQKWAKGRFAENSSMHRFMKASGAMLDRLSYLMKHGKKDVFAAFLASVVFNFSFVGLIMVFCYELGLRDGGRLIAIPLLYMSYNIILPTPGGAGLAELSAPAFFIAFTPQQALAMVIVSRLFTYALQILIGLVFLFFKLKGVVVVLFKSSEKSRGV